MNRLYHWARCSSCREVQQLLAAENYKFEERDWFAERLSNDELDELAGWVGGIAALVAVQSPSFRKLNRPLEAISESELKQLILSEPRLLRRPLLITDQGKAISGARAIKDYLARK